MPTWTVDFKDLQSTIDEMIRKLEDKPKTKNEQSSKSDLVDKYKKLYQASLKIERLTESKQDCLKEISFYNETIAKIDLEIEELNKLFSN
jgi:predicted RNase H-like nuclease (RuvC/YqgF family)